MHITLLDEADIPAVIDLILQNYDGVMARHHRPETIAKFRAEVTASALQTQMRWKYILVARIDGKAVATGAIANFGSLEAPRYTVSQVYVRPDLHGQGIGKVLMNELLAYVRKLGHAICHVPSSRNAIAFYRSFGFLVDAAQPDATDEITWMTLRS